MVSRQISFSNGFMFFKPIAVTMSRDFVYLSNSFFEMHIFSPYFFHISLGGRLSMKSISVEIFILPSGSVE
ncbi:hypothetical protein CEG18_28615 [Pseudomonas nitroreducens]|uniref:Uncharacterized protein n=1 Tax=Pseudomonas nitroreducens TaxID=46680 RepID=A0A246F383_PSENT|nr:hypothetical protein CEG18_28615 [Pseudomonas nitroreducens]